MPGWKKRQKNGKRNNLEETDMSDASRFVIEYGAVKKYIGPGGDVVIPEGLTAILWGAFYGCPIEQVRIPGSVRAIAKGAFRNCKKLKEIVLPDSLESVADDAFVDCSEDLVIRCSGEIFTALCKETKDALTMLWLTEKTEFGEDQTAAIIKYAGRTRDRQFTRLQEDNGAAAARLLTWGKTKPEKLEEYIRMFSDGKHPNVLAVLLDHKDKTVPKAKAEEIADKELGLAEKTAKDWAKVYRWQEENGTITLTKYKGIDSRVELPWDIEGVPVSKIGKNAFKGNVNLEEIILSPSIVEIMDSAFEGCEKLASIVWNEKLVTIGKRAFFGCYQLSVIKLPASVVELGVNSFSAKFNFDDTPLMHLSEVYLPESIKVYKQFLGEFMDYCVDVHFLGKKTKITAKDFFAATVKIFVPAGSKTEEYAKKAGLAYVAE